jgi:hypothetical protein
MATGEWATPKIDGSAARRTDGGVDARLDALASLDSRIEAGSDRGNGPGARTARDGRLPGDLPARVLAALASYPPIAACLLCREYALDHDADADRWSVVAATLAYHDMSHRDDPLSLGCEHFGPLD